MTINTSEFYKHLIDHDGVCFFGYSTACRHCKCLASVDGKAGCNRFLNVIKAERELNKIKAAKIKEIKKL